MFMLKNRPKLLVFFEIKSETLHWHILLNTNKINSLLRFMQDKFRFLSSK